MNDFWISKEFWGAISLAGFMMFMAGMPGRLKRRKQQALDAVFEALDFLILPHLDTLAKKRRRLVQYDDYGVAKDDAWMSEIDYFLNNVVLPSGIFQEALENLKKVEGPSFSFSRLSRYSFNWVDTQAKERESQLPENTGDATTASQWAVEHLTPLEFEHYCAEVLRENGWRAHVTQASGDQGIDVIAWRKGIKAVLQCKKYDSLVGNSAVQEIVAGRGYEEAQVAAVVSNVGFTPAAISLANANQVYLMHYSELRDFSDRIAKSNLIGLPTL